MRFIGSAAVGVGNLLKLGGLAVLILICAVGLLLEVFFGMGRGAK